MAACMQRQKQKKATKTKATQPGKQVYLDAAGPFKPSIGRSKFDAKSWWITILTKPGLPTSKQNSDC